MPLALAGCPAVPAHTIFPAQPGLHEQTGKLRQATLLAAQRPGFLKGMQVAVECLLLRSLLDVGTE